jgi:hypothetical protein
MLRIANTNTGRNYEKSCLMVFKMILLPKAEMVAFYNTSKDQTERKDSL